MSTATSHSPRQAPTTGGGRVRERLVAVAAATVAALAVWVVVEPILGIDLRASMGSSAPVLEVSPGSVIATAMLASLAGWALLASLERAASRPARVWTVVAVVAALLSLSGPLTGGLTTATTVALGVMHLVVAAVLIPLMRRTTGSRPGTS